MMGVDPVLELYNRIIHTETAAEMLEIQREIKDMALAHQFDDQKDMLILNLAIQMKSNFFLYKSLEETAQGTTVILVGKDFDPEEMELEGMEKEEIEELDENVITMDKFKKDD